MKVYLFVSVLLATAYYGHAEESQKESAIKDMIVREIMKKVSNITLNTLSKVADDKKEMMLSKINQKLKKSASGLTDGHKYVKLIMEGLKRNAFENTEEKKTHNVEETITKEVKGTTLNADKHISGLQTDQLNINRKLFDKQTKEHIIMSISKKIDSMAKQYLRESQTLKQKEKILDDIKKRIIDSSSKKHALLHDQHTELKKYSNLITQGLELSMKKLLRASKSRRIAGDTEAEIQNDKDTNTINMDHIKDYKAFFIGIRNDVSIDPRCNETVEEICYRIGSLHKLMCGDGSIISLEQLCDGASDCWNGADETKCTEQAIAKSRLAIALISDIEQAVALECFYTVDNTMFSHHHKVVTNMLTEQLRLLEKHMVLELRMDPEDQLNVDDDMFIKNLISDFTRTVSLLSDTFDTSLCPFRSGIIKKENVTRKSNDLDSGFLDDDAKREESKWLPKSCTCKNQFCESDDCDVRCKHICWQKYSLNNWKCQSLTGGKTISLDFICDGKLDCFDETDETSCTTDSTVTKYEANAIYKDLLDILALKSLSVEFDKSRNKMATQTNLVRDLQKLTTKHYADVHTIKIARDGYFKTLVDIYEDMLQTSNLEELDNTYEFLHAMNKQMIGALKLSHTGNEHVVAPAGCYCNNGTCALVRCSRKCNATCLAEPALTKYSCNVNDTSVHIKAICNGKKECPNEEDEKDCQQEVCRAHHLLVLRHNLQKAGMSLKGSVLGEVMDSWKSKVMASLIVAQNSERPNHKMLEDIVVKVLSDLVAAFATMEETRRTSPELVLKEFTNMSNIVKQTLKFCV